MKSTKKTTGKFEQKRVEILDAAAALINVIGVKGMTFADVACKVGLNEQPDQETAIRLYASTLAYGLYGPANRK